MMPNRLFLVALIALLAACEPMGPIPGRALSGEPAEYPASWEFLQEFEVVQLETDGPYSVNIWAAADNSNVYIAAAEGSETQWAQRIARDPEVRLRVGEDLYSLTAVVVEDESELSEAAGAFNAKYNLDAEGDFPNAIIYRLDRR